MITSSDSFNTYEIEKYYIILPSIHDEELKAYKKRFKVKKVPENFVYSSGANKTFLTINELKELINTHIK